jgi:hypothetical protein
MGSYPNESARNDSALHRLRLDQAAAAPNVQTPSSRSEDREVKTATPRARRQDQQNSARSLRRGAHDHRPRACCRGSRLKGAKPRSRRQDREPEMEVETKKVRSRTQDHEAKSAKPRARSQDQENSARSSRRGAHDHRPRACCRGPRLKGAMKTASQRWKSRPRRYDREPKITRPRPRPRD